MEFNIWKQSKDVMLLFSTFGNVLAALIVLDLHFVCIFL